ncbi:MAG: ATP-dependent zinc metalloprotease FtsH [Spirochaetaceae bacterium]|nr:ATP-dependent zinc metalloprotease FtsH [Spirochaetaceae bacterium]
MSDNHNNDKDDEKKGDDKNEKNKDFWKNRPNKNDKKGGGVQPTPNPQPFRPSFIVLASILGLVILANSFFGNSNRGSEIAYSDFKALIISGQIRQVRIASPFIYGYALTDSEAAAAASTEAPARPAPFSGDFLGRPRAVTNEVSYRAVLVSDPTLLPLLEEHNVIYRAVVPRNNDFISSLVIMGIFIAIFILVSRSLFKRMGGGANVMNFGQNKNRIVAETDLNTRFNDVAGCDEAKGELVEVVDFLKHPTRYTDIGGKIPKGVLLVGPPGTGKTLLARAVAGEAGVAFFRVSGADFVEMFVGVGAARVRDLFGQARQKAPCIIFIDEMDAIGKSRANNFNSNDEREQTLNQLLVEMDGFDSTTGVIVLSATNRPEILDPALLRAGRFDRQVLVDKPDVKGREAILKIHSKDVKLNDDVDLHKIAEGTPGFVGSDLANVVNEAALLAVRAGRKEVARVDFEEAIEKSALGLAKKSKVMSNFERETTAFHEIGHALASVFTAGTDPLRKITIIPRGMALGVTWSDPVEGRYSKTQDEFIAMIDMALGGRAAEEVVYGRITTGAGGDIQHITDIAKSMIMRYGMSKKFKNVALTRRQGLFLDGGESSPEYSEKTQEYIDDEVSRLIAQRYDRVINLLKKHEALLYTITKEILIKETLSSEEFLAFVKADELGNNELNTVKELEKSNSRILILTDEDEGTVITKAAKIEITLTDEDNKAVDNSPSNTDSDNENNS